MKAFKRISAFASAAATTFTLSSAAYAQTASSYLGRINGVVTGDLETWIFGLINWAIGIAAVLSVVILIAAGYMYITAAGDEGKIEKATKTLTWAIIGLVIAFISVILVQFVLKNVLGVA